MSATETTIDDSTTIRSIRVRSCSRSSSSPWEISQYRLAQAIDVPPRRINEIVHGKRGISTDTALRLSRALGTSDRFWLNLQTRYDLDAALAAHEEELGRIPLLEDGIT